MIINTTPENIAVLGNVSNVGEFRIKNSAKAFSILSSGLYANKIRAIIRELSCNAYDSHVAAGKKSVAFDIHLPTTLEPYFYVRDYGTGLTHDQVVNIYTTYFESTKTESNDFIGALGLGSKSPFSYTDNFTVTAIKDGIKGIYSAFINEHGVPSTALMSTTETTEENGVEVKFAVDAKSDFDKFRNETSEVLAYFDVVPNMTGGICKIRERKYLERDVIAGVNVMDVSSYDSSIALMGNIPYPIDVPNAESNLGNLAVHLSKGLEIRFNIGELEFQASREGLSYTKETIAAIKNKLQLLQDKLDGILFAEADAVVNVWERAEFLINKYKVRLWQNSIKNYVKNNKVNKILECNSYGTSYKRISFSEKELAEDYNIKVTGIISPTWTGDTISQIKMSKVYNNATRIYEEKWDFVIGPKSRFVKYDKFRGGLEHVKYHYKQNPTGNINHYIYILSPVKSDEPIKYKEFFEDMVSPPSSCIIEMSELDEKPKDSRKTYDYVITALYLGSSGSYRDKNYVWQPAGDISQLDNTKIYYYIPLKGYAPIPKDGCPITDVKELMEDIKNCGIATLSSISTIYGIRKADMEAVSKMTNWVNIQDHLISIISSVNVDSLIGSYAKNALHSNVFNGHTKTVKLVTDRDSEYIKFISKCYNVSSMQVGSLDNLCKVYGGNVTSQTFMDKIKQEVKSFAGKYPLLQHIDYRADATHIAQYINMVDELHNKKLITV